MRVCAPVRDERDFDACASTARGMRRAAGWCTRTRTAGSVMPLKIIKKRHTTLSYQIPIPLKNNQKSAVLGAIPVSYREIMNTAPIQHRVVPVALSADLRPVAARGGDLTQIVTHRSGPARGQNLASARPARRAARAACGRARVATIGTFRLTLPLRTVAVTESETRYRIPGPLERRGSTRTERTSKVHTYFSDRRHVNCAESGRPTVLSTPK